MDIEPTQHRSPYDDIDEDDPSDFADDPYGYEDDPYGCDELEDLRAIPPLRRPEDMPPVHSQADLHRHWRALMGELGFAQTRLYIQLFTIDGTCAPVVLDITDIPELPDAAMADGLLQFCARVLDQAGEPGMRVGILYARPGGRSRRHVDRAWAFHITEASRRHGVPIFPVHVANDEEVTVVSPDELVRPA